jgi:hypothetical protein
LIASKSSASSKELRFYAQKGIKAFSFLALRVAFLFFVPAKIRLTGQNYVLLAQEKNP